MAAFVNATTARSVNFTDTYQWPGSFGGHPAMSLRRARRCGVRRERAGREFITGVVLGI